MKESEADKLKIGEQLEVIKNNESEINGEVEMIGDIVNVETIGAGGLTRCTLENGRTWWFTPKSIQKINPEKRSLLIKEIKKFTSLK